MIDKEFLEENEEEIPFKDKRRFNSEDEKTDSHADKEKSKEPARTALETELENKLKEEKY